MSTTVDPNVANRYSGVHQGREATVFELELDKMSLGADVAWLSQFAAEQEMLFPPFTHLQIVGEPRRGEDGVSVVTLKPTTFQNTRTVEEAAEERKEDMKQLASDVTWDLRNKAAGMMTTHDSELRQRFDALQARLVADHCSHEPEWYNDNVKFKGAFKGLLQDAEKARKAVFDDKSLIAPSGSLAEPSGNQVPQGVGESTTNTQPKRSSEAAEDTNEVSRLHSKFCQDPDFKGIRGRFGNDTLFAAGIDAIVGKMPDQFVMMMFVEHVVVEGARAVFQAWNAGNVIETTAEREWKFVVGDHGLDTDSWQFLPENAEPHIAEGMMVRGRNAKRLADLLRTDAAIKAKLSAAEVVAVRLYTGASYLRAACPFACPFAALSFLPHQIESSLRFMHLQRFVGV